MISPTLLEVVLHRNFELCIRSAKLQTDFLCLDKPHSILICKSLLAMTKQEISIKFKVFDLDMLFFDFGFVCNHGFFGHLFLLVK